MSPYLQGEYSVAIFTLSVIREVTMLIIELFVTESSLDDFVT